MQSPPSAAPEELECCECGKKFESAASLLQHFAGHASDSLLKSKKRGAVPDLYPIKPPRGKKPCDDDKEENGDSGVEDLVNPLKYCQVTLLEDEGVGGARRKYQCGHCSRSFGWSTDLKRHVLTHTGERPFRCQSCECRFTRNFLLQKHVQRCHHEPPPLKPLPPRDEKAKPPRKQEKCNIKRKASQSPSRK